MLRLHEAESKLAVVQSEKETAEEQVRNSIFKNRFVKASLELFSKHHSPSDQIFSTRYFFDQYSSPYLTTPPPPPSPLTRYVDLLHSLVIQGGVLEFNNR
jgi:hypothetical protein